MKRILVPINFSVPSGNALQYAHHLADHLGLGLSLVHCYSAQEYSRPYNFGKKDYHTGIREMLKEFYHELVKEPGKEPRYLAKMGSVVEQVATMSCDFQMTILSSNTPGGKLIRWMGSRTSSIASMAQCPVMIIPPDTKYEPWNKIWHIDRNPNETPIIEKRLKRVKIDPALVEHKSLHQTTFTSVLWQSIVSYVKTPKADLLEAIKEASKQEKIDLIILVSHQKNSFRKFVNHDAFQAIFQYNIPVLIFQE